MASRQLQLAPSNASFRNILAEAEEFRPLAHALGTFIGKKWEDVALDRDHWGALEDSYAEATPNSVGWRGR